MLRFLKIYLLPGAVLQSVNVAGGYGTGRELVEFFTRHGMGEGLAGMVLATLCMSATFAMTLVLAVRFQAFDYRHFFKVLLGRYWFLFEILGVTLFVVVLAVMGAAAGEILSAELGLPSGIGGIVMLVCVVLLNFFGRDWVTRVLASWSLLLYAVFIAYFVAVLGNAGTSFDTSVFRFELRGDWLVSALQYALYNVAGIPIILYAARAIETERQGAAAGLIGGLVTMMPGLMFHLSFSGSWPAITDAALPVYSIFESLGLPLLKGFYLVVLFGTFIETGAGNVQGFIERLDGWWVERTGAPFSRLHHGGVAALALLISGTLSSVGIVGLIAEGYGTLAWGYLVLYLVPLFTIGVVRLRGPGAAAVVGR
jgi:uncharacterized membrane protein YkvI